MFRARTLAFPYATGATLVMPHEEITLATGLDTWTWEAPGETGRCPLEVRNPAGAPAVNSNAFVMVPSTQVRDGVLTHYRTGSYPKTPLKRNPAYEPPKGFIEVTGERQDTKVSPNFRIRQFLTKQTGGYPKYLVLDERLIFLLEAIGRMQSRWRTCWSSSRPPPELAPFIGGIGVYAATSAHGPFVHLDTRSWKARW